MEGLAICEPMFKVISEAEAFGSLPLKVRPELGLGWWLANKDLMAQSCKRWEAATPSECLSYALDWILFVAPKQSSSKALLNSQFPELIDLFEKGQHRLELDDIRNNHPAALGLRDDKSNYLESKHAWDRILQKLTLPQLIHIAPSFKERTYTGAVLSFIDLLRNMEASDLKMITAVLPKGLWCSEADIIRNKHIARQQWNAPLEGLYLLSGTGILKNMKILEAPEVSQFLNIVELFGLNAESGDALRNALALQWGLKEAPLALSIPDMDTLNV